MLWRASASVADTIAGVVRGVGTVCRESRESIISPQRPTRATSVLTFGSRTECGYSVQRKLSAGRWILQVRKVSLEWPRMASNGKSATVCYHMSDRGVYMVAHAEA